MVLGERNGMQPMSVERLIVQPPLLPNWLSVQGFRGKTQSGRDARRRHRQPLHAGGPDGSRLRRRASGSRASTCRRCLAALRSGRREAPGPTSGLYYAEKLRGAVALQTYRTTGSAEETGGGRPSGEVAGVLGPGNRDHPAALQGHAADPLQSAQQSATEDNFSTGRCCENAIAADVEVARASEYAKQR